MDGSEGRDDQRGARVGLADVRRVEDVVAEFRGLDYRYAQAILSANQAWAHAKKADVTEALTYLRRAREEFAEAEGPSPWDAFFGATDMAAMVGTVHGELAQMVDIQHGRDGIPALTDAIAGYGRGMTRSRSLTLIWLATVHALDGDLDVATAVGEEAIELAIARRFSGNADAREIVDRIDDLGHSG